MFERLPAPISLGRPLRISVALHCLAVLSLTLVRAPSTDAAKPARSEWTALVVPPVKVEAPPAPRLRRTRGARPSRQAFVWPAATAALQQEVPAPPVLALSKPPLLIAPMPVPAAPLTVAEPPRIQVGGFAPAAMLEPVARPQLPVSVGGFVTATASSGSGSRGAVVNAPTGFDRVRPSVREARERRPIADAGFTAVETVAASRPRRTEVEEPLSVGVEILDKPRPAYSEEARRLKIEGEVVLEVLFTASGEVRVQRLIRSLGHGLDQNAIQAAERIRFRPAMRGGAPADQVATVQITFHLAY